MLETKVPSVLEDNSGSSWLTTAWKQNFSCTLLLDEQCTGKHIQHVVSAQTVHPITGKHPVCFIKYSYLRVKCEGQETSVSSPSEGETFAPGFQPKDKLDIRRYPGNRKKYIKCTEV